LVDIVTLSFKDGFQNYVAVCCFPLLFSLFPFVVRNMVVALKPAFEKQVPKSDIFLMLLPEGQTCF
jgi:hypothetical protein